MVDSPSISGSIAPKKNNRKLYKSKKWSGIWNMEYGIWNMESGIFILYP